MFEPLENLDLRQIKTYIKNVHYFQAGQRTCRKQPPPARLNDDSTVERKKSWLEFPARYEVQPCLRSSK